jgi:hypothetical protein
MYIIAIFKKAIRVHFEQHIIDTTAAANAAASKAKLETFLAQSLSVARIRKFGILSVAIKDVTPQVVQKSWRMTGIPRVLEFKWTHEC